MPWTPALAAVTSHRPATYARETRATRGSCVRTFDARRRVFALADRSYDLNSPRNLRADGYDARFSARRAAFRSLRRALPVKPVSTGGTRPRSYHSCGSFPSGYHSFRLSGVALA